MVYVVKALDLSDDRCQQSLDKSSSYRLMDYLGLLRKPGLIWMQADQKLLAWNAWNAIDRQSLLAEIQQTRRCFGIVLAEGTQGTKVLAMHTGGALDLDGPESIGTINDEIHLAA